MAVTLSTRSADMGRAGSDVNPPRRQEDVKDPNALVAAQDRADNEALKSLTQAPIDALKRGVTAIRDYIMYTVSYTHLRAHET